MHSAHPMQLKNTVHLVSHSFGFPAHHDAHWSCRRRALVLAVAGKGEATTRLVSFMSRSGGACTGGAGGMAAFTSSG